MKPTIRLNHRKYPWREGATVRSLMAENNFNHSYMIVKINGTLIEDAAWESTAVAAGDRVEIIHVFGGG